MQWDSHGRMWAKLLLMFVWVALHNSRIFSQSNMPTQNKRASELKVWLYWRTPAAIVTDWCHPSVLSFLSLVFKPPTRSWPQTEGQIAECPVPSRTHYTRLETEREQRSLCDTAGQKLTDMQEEAEERDWTKGIKSTNKEWLRKTVRLMKQPLEINTERPLAMWLLNEMSTQKGAWYIYSSCCVHVHTFKVLANALIFMWLDVLVITPHF